jgi:ribosome maturation factor RimP
MIEKDIIEAYLKEILEGKNMFLVEVKVDSNSKIRVHIDKMEGISIDDCAAVSRELEEKLDRDKEDFALEVSSPGLDSPFRVREQYDKNIGKMVSVQFKDGSKIRGILKEAGENRMLLEIKESKKGRDQELQELDLQEIVSTRLHIQF